MGILAAALTLLLQAESENSGEQFHKFKVGTTWTFKKVEIGKGQGRVGTVTLEVESVEGGKVYLEETEEWPNGGRGGVEKLVWYVDNGMLIWEQERPEGPPLRTFTYKLGSKKGDSWESDGTTFKHMGTTRLKVPAGTYKNVVTIKMEAWGWDYLFLAPRVGPVRMEGGALGDNFVMELMRFTEGK